MQQARVCHASARWGVEVTRGGSACGPPPEPDAWATAIKRPARASPRGRRKSQPVRGGGASSTTGSFSPPFIFLYLWAAAVILFSTSLIDLLMKEEGSTSRITEIEENGGVYLLVAKLPSSYLQFKQFLGRTGRIGNKSQYSVILLDQDAQNEDGQSYLEKKLEIL